MKPKAVIQSQYLAALEILKQVIVRCPAAGAPFRRAKVFDYLAFVYRFRR